jgi:hypothetical protein
MNTPILARDARIDERQITEGSKLTESPSRLEASQIKLLSVALAAIIFALGALLMSGMAEAAGAGCVGVQVSPGDGLTRTAATSPAGTTFCINDGTYYVSSNIPVQDGDTFTGVYSDGTRPEVKGVGAEHVFYTAGADNATIRGLAVSGAVGGDYCEPTCGRGIGGGGNNLLIEDVRAYENANQGAGGLGSGAIVRNSQFDHNGSASFSDLAGPRSSAGLKTVASIKVYNSTFTNNYWNGFWCDVECNATEVHDSVLSRNGKAGLAYEISSGPAIFEGNTIRGNGQLDSANRHVGLLIVESSNVNAYGNTFGENVEQGVVFAKGDRHPLDKVSFHDNTMNGDLKKGCDLSGVSCYENRR